MERAPNTDSELQLDNAPSLSRRLIGVTKSVPAGLAFAFFDGANPPIEDVQGVAIWWAVAGVKILSPIVFVHGLIEVTTGKEHTLFPQQIDTK